MIGLGARLIPEARSLFELERMIPVQPTAVKHRALARAKSSLAVLPSAISFDVASIRGAGFSRRGLAAAAFLAATFGAGAYGLAEWLAHHRHEGPPSADAVPHRVRPGLRTSHVRSQAPAGDPLPPLPPVPAAVPHAAPSEVGLLTHARRSMMQGDFEGALPLLALHARRYPVGRLAEEREALRVRVLVALGRGDDAKRAARSFARRFPASPLGPVVAELTQQP